MGSVGIGIKRVIQDVDGEVATVTGNRLDVNAYLSATPTIDIGDVSLLLGGTAADTGLGTYGAQTLRVTMAADDALLSAMNTNLADIETLLTTIDTDTGSMVSAFNAPVHASGDTHASNYGQGILGVRNDELAALGLVADGDYSFLQVNALGALYTTGGEVENAAVQSEPTLVGGRYDSSARTLGSGDAGAVALNASGHMLMDVVDGGQLDTIIDTLETTLTAIETDQAAIEALLITIDSDTDAIKTATELIDDAVYTENDDWAAGSSKHLLVGGINHNNSIAADDTAPLRLSSNGAVVVAQTSSYRILSASTAAIGKVGHDITGMVSDENTAVGTSAEKIHTAADVAIKHIDIQADPDNTGIIFVGDSGVAGNGSGGGIRLNPGDFYSLDIDNTADVYVAASVADEDVAYIYYT